MAVPGIKTVAGAASAAGDKIKKLKSQVAAMLASGPPKAPDPPDEMIPALAAGGVPPPKSADGFTLAPLEEGDPSDVDQQLEDWVAQWEKSNAYQRVAGEGVRDYVARLRSMAADDKHKPGVAKAVSDLESGFATAIKEGRVGALLPEGAGPAAAVHNATVRDYIDYLAASGVDQRTLDAIASGDLPMDAASRTDRARMMGLDPHWRWGHE